MIAVYRNDDKHFPTNFQPAPLAVGITCKTLRHVIYSYLVNFLNQTHSFVQYSTFSEKLVLVKLCNYLSKLSLWVDCPTMVEGLSVLERLIKQL